MQAQLLPATRRVHTRLGECVAVHCRFAIENPQLQRVLPMYQRDMDVLRKACRREAKQRFAIEHMHGASACIGSVNPALRGDRHRGYQSELICVGFLT